MLLVAQWLKCVVRKDAPLRLLLPNMVAELLYPMAILVALWWQLHYGLCAHQDKFDVAMDMDLNVSRDWFPLCHDYEPSDEFKKSLPHGGVNSLNFLINDSFEANLELEDMNVTSSRILAQHGA